MNTTIMSGSCKVLVTRYKEEEEGGGGGTKGPTLPHLAAALRRPTPPTPLFCSTQHPVSLTVAPRWSVEETQSLLEAWAPVHQRRRQAQGDPWVPPQRRSSVSLVDEDWRTIAVAVNRDGRANRTAEQCKSRMKYLRTRYAVELFEKKASPSDLFTVVHPFFAGEAPPKSKGDPSSAAEEDGDPSSAAAAAAEEFCNDGEAGGSRAGGTARTSVEAVLLRVTDMYERVMLKWLENDAAEKASRN